MKKNFLILSALVLSLSSHAVTIQKVKFQKNKTEGKVKIHYKGVLRTTPELRIKNNEIVVSIPKANFKKGLKGISRRENFATTSSADTIINGRYDKSATNISLKLPFNIEKKKHSVSMSIKDSYILLSLPRVRVKNPTASNAIVSEKVIAKKEVKKSNKKLEDILGEKYLSELIQKDKSDKSAVKVVKKEVKFDEIVTTQAAIKKDSNKFSMVSYLGKFVAFLGFVLLLFYGLVLMFKKGVFKRTKLGFLNNTDQIEVLSQTHISPKKTLMMVKVHKQVFLLSNTESGMQFLSEITDPMGVVKGGEKILSGDNFDTNLVDQNQNVSLESKIVLKENILESKPLNDNKKGFRSELKKKIKDLKPLQQV